MRRLIIRPGAIGDCLLALPAIEFLQTDQTELWVPSALCPLFGATGIPAANGFERVRSIASTGLDRFGLGDGFVPIRLSESLQRFDDIVSWYGENREEFRKAALRLNPHWRFLRALPPGDCPHHASDYFLTQVGGAAPPVSKGVKESGARPNRRQGAIAIHPFSGNNAKNWPLGCYRELARQLAAGAEVVLLAGPEEELPEARRFDDLRSLADWLSGVALYIGNDSGPTHLAAVVRTPVLALFGPTTPSVWAPRGPHVTVLQREPLAALRVDEVVMTARRILRGVCDI